MNNPFNKNNKNIDLMLADTKNKILEYLYKSDIQIDTKHESILTMKDMDNIRDNDYVICPRFSGTRSWVIFFSTDQAYFAVSFPKHNQRKREEIRIHAIDITVRKIFYRGTIMEGIYFQNNNKKYLVIDEVYKLAGEDQILKPKEDRLANLAQYIKKSMSASPNYCISVSQVYNINEKSLKKLYDKIKTEPSIQELIFYPRLYGLKIYTYTILDSDLTDNIIKISIFNLQKTSNPDVYNLLTLENKNKIGIAYIPNIETSKKCKQWFKDYKKKTLVVKCHLHIEKQKWIPMEIVESDLLNNSEDSCEDEPKKTKNKKSNKDKLKKSNEIDNSDEDSSQVEKSEDDRSNEETEETSTLVESYEESKDDESRTKRNEILNKKPIKRKTKNSLY